MTQDGWPGAWAAQERLERGAERLRSASGQAEDEAARVPGLTTRLKEVSGSGWTPDRAVVVTVDVAGRLIVLELGSRAHLMDPPALADVILRCVSQAQDEVAEEVSHSVPDLGRGFSADQPDSPGSVRPPGRRRPGTGELQEEPAT